MVVQGWVLVVLLCVNNLLLRSADQEDEDQEASWARQPRTRSHR